MTTDTRLVTAEELIKLPRDRRCELVRGEIIDMTPSGFEHGAVITNIQMLVGRFVKANKLGTVVGAETGFTLFRGPDTVRGVDVGFVQTSRIPKTGRPKSYFEGAPDLAVEVLSPDDRMKAVNEKIEDYLKAGALEVVVVSPKRKTVAVHRRGAEPILFQESDRLTGLQSLPDFECAVAEIFE